MNRPFRSLSYRALTLLLAPLPLGCTSQRVAPPSSPTRIVEPAAPVPAFTDPLRRSKLASAFPKIDAKLREMMDQGTTPGLVLGVVIDGELAWTGAYGVRDREHGDKVDANTAFRIYSVTKTITAMAVMQLRDEGKVVLDDPAEKYIPEMAGIRYTARDAAPITVRQLLAHDAGLPHFTSARAKDPIGGVTEAEILDALRDLPLVGPPNVQYKYSSLGYSLLGVVIHRVSGMPYRAYIQEKILKPLGMTSSTFDATAIPPGARSTGYDNDGPAIKIAPVDHFGDDAPEGGLFSTVPDLARYAALQLSAWPARSDAESPVIRRSTVREMHHVATFRELWADAWIAPDSALRLRAGADGYGLGWGTTATCDYQRLVTFEGGDAGYHSAVLMLPEYGVGVVSLANSGDANGNPAYAALKLLLASGGLAPRVTPPNPALLVARDGIGALLEKWDDGVAPKFFRPRELSSLSFKSERFRRMHHDHGHCTMDGDLTASSAVNGHWRMACERGAITFEGQLVGGQAAFEELDWEEASPPTPAMTAAATSLLDLIAVGLGSGGQDPFDDAGAQSAFLKDAAGLGRCTNERMLVGDGRTEATFSLVCEHGKRELAVSLDSSSAKVKAATLKVVGGRLNCTP